MSTIPEHFENVTAVTRANVYFDGKVVSHTILFADGSKKTLGLIFPGEYSFETATPECMSVTAGVCRVRLSDEDAWTTHNEGQSFDVPSNSEFEIAVDEGVCQYICSYC